MFIFKVYIMMMLNMQNTGAGLMMLDSCAQVKTAKTARGIFALARRDLAGLLAASQEDSTQPGRKRNLLNCWFRRRGVWNANRQQACRISKWLPRDNAFPAF